MAPRLLLPWLAFALVMLAVTQMLGADLRDKITTEAGMSGWPIAPWLGAFLMLALLALLARSRFAVASRLRFIALPIVALAVIEIISCVDGATRLYQDEFRSTKVTLGGFAEPMLELLSRSDAESPNDDAEIALRLQRMAQIVPSIRDILIAVPGKRLVEFTVRHGTIFAREANALPANEKFDLGLAFASSSGTTELGFGQLLIKLDRMKLLSRAAEFLTQSLAAGFVAALLLAETMLFLWPSAARARRIPIRDGSDVELSVALRQSRALAAAVACASVLPWPLFWQISRHVPELSGLTGHARPLLFLAMQMSAACVSAILGAALDDRYGWRVPALLGLMLGAVGAGMAALAPHWAFLAIAWACLGAGEGMASIALFALATSTYPKDKIDRKAVSLFGGMLCGTLIGILTGGLLATHLGFASVFAICALIWLSACVGVIAVKNDRKAPLRRLVAAPADAGRPLVDFARLLDERQIATKLVMIASAVALAEIFLLRLPRHGGSVLAGWLGAAPEPALFGLAALPCFWALSLIRKEGSMRRSELIGGFILALASPLLFWAGGTARHSLAAAVGGCGLALLLHGFAALARRSSMKSRMEITVLRFGFIGVKLTEAVALLALAGARIASGSSPMLVVGYGAALAVAAVLILVALSRRRGQSPARETPQSSFARP
jgi:MFS family permease